MCACVALMCMGVVEMPAGVLAVWGHMRSVGCLRVDREAPTSGMTDDMIASRTTWWPASTTHGFRWRGKRMEWAFARALHSVVTGANPAPEVNPPAASTQAPADVDVLMGSTLSPYFLCVGKSLTDGYFVSVNP